MKSMTSKKFIIPVIAALVILFAIIVITKIKSNGDVVLSLDSFKSDNIYQFDDIKWGMSVDEVSRKLPTKLEKDTARVPLSSSSQNIVFYNCKNRYLLDEQISNASFEFHNGELKSIQFSFHLQDDYHQWFENQVKKLTETYGTETKKTESSSDKTQMQRDMQSIVYVWDTDSTTLQFALLTGESIKPTATLSIGLK